VLHHLQGLTEVSTRLPRPPSKGFRQRVRLALASPYPAGADLDEPTIRLNPRQIIEITEPHQHVRVSGRSCSRRTSSEVVAGLRQVVVHQRGTRGPRGPARENLTRTRTLEEVFIEAISRDTSDGARAAAAPRSSLMRNALTIAGKEVRSYFASPVAYVLIAAYVASAGYFFYALLTAFKHEPPDLQHDAEPGDVSRASISTEMSSSRSFANIRAIT